MAVINLVKTLGIVAILIALIKTDDEVDGFDFNDGEEMMIAQESRQYQTAINPPVKIIKPKGVTNSHRPQYNIDSYEESVIKDSLDNLVNSTNKQTIVKNYKSSTKLRSKEVMIRDAVLRALDRKDHVGKFAQVLPIIRAMSGNQRVALASLVASQVNTPPGRAPLNLLQVRSMFGNNQNTTADLMLPILLDMANLVRRAIRTGKETREVKTQQLNRRSFDTLEDELFNTGTNDTQHNNTELVTTTHVLRNRRRVPQRGNQNTTNKDTYKSDNKTIVEYSEPDNTKFKNSNITVARSTQSAADDEGGVQSNNSTLDLTAESSNQTITQNLPVPEKLRSLNRFMDRRGNLIRRGTYPPKLPSVSTATRRNIVESTLSPIRRRPQPMKKAAVTTGDQGKCELFTNTLCLNIEDYPAEAILQSIKRNKAAAGALLADFKNPGDGAVDGVTPDQESKYTADHYFTSNRRGDTSNRDFASAGEAGFMCPSTVKYARPQRARATSGQWKYIVNTGEHTQTLRLEKCLKPKESCTYLTDNFISKCVQVYNYHRLLTWDQQNGLHMDIFKVPTCCSCHIEGYSVSFPPLGQRIHESSSEQFPGEDLSSEHGNHAFESVQPSIQRPTVTKTPAFTFNKPLEVFPPFSDNHNLISATSFTSTKLGNNDDFNTGGISDTGPMDSYGNHYFADSFNQGTSIRNVRRPSMTRNPISPITFDSATLPSFLEPPTPLAPSSFDFVKETQNKFKVGSPFKRGIRPSHRPIRKKISSGSDDLVSAGTSAVQSVEAMDDFNESIDEADLNRSNITFIPTRRDTIAPKLPAVTTERVSTTFKSLVPSVVANKNVTSNTKKVNYNYHPIIDFFGDEEKEFEEDSIDREDLAVYSVSSESEWKPINHPLTRSSQKINSNSRFKH